jgi:CrcB protein
MTTSVLVGVAVAGAIGAPARFLLDGVIHERLGDPHRTGFPWGTFAVNVSGSLVLGLVTGAALYHGFHGAPKVWLGTGFCGAYTTFSTFTFESLRLVEEDAGRLAVANVIGSAVAGTAAAAIGLALAAAL